MIGGRDFKIEKKNPIKSNVDFLLHMADDKLRQSGMKIF